MCRRLMPPRRSGVPHDIQNARKMASDMGLADSAVFELRDSQATKANIEARLAELSRKVQNGDRAFLYLAGHGTRWVTSAGCKESFLTYDGGALSE